MSTKTELLKNRRTGSYIYCEQRDRIIEKQDSTVTPQNLEKIQPERLNNMKVKSRTRKTKYTRQPSDENLVILARKK